jgi:dipeptidyl aminopeptidase/acylaminoacyl peptidase
MPAKKRITAEDLYQLEMPSGCIMSPDGRFVLTAVNRVDAKTEKKYANLWRFATDKNQPRQFTFGEHVDSQPCWSPDGQQIAFLSNRGGAEQAQIHLMYADGGEARPLTDIKGKIGSLEWSPDGKQHLSTVRKLYPDELARAENEQKKKLGIAARHVTRVRYKFDGQGYLPQEQWHIWTVNARTGKATQLTDDLLLAEDSPCWSPDGTQIAFLSNRHDDPDFNPEKISVCLMPAKGGDIGIIPTPDGDKTQLRFSPDGQWLAYYGRIGRGEWWRHMQLWLVPAAGQSTARCLTDPFDYSLGNDSINDLGGADTMPPIWSPDSQSLLFQISQHGNTTLHRIQVDGTHLETIIDVTGVIGAYDLDKSHNKIAYFQADIQEPGQLWVRNLTSQKQRQLTRLNQKMFRQKELGQIEEVWFKGPDNNDLQGWIMKPPDFDASQKYPSILEIHGGPLAQYGNFFMHEFEFLAAHGYVVYFSNPRGGRGYGEAHAQAIWNDHGGADYDDVMAWANYVRQLPYIDETCMGVTGGSYGGFMVNWIIGHTQMFKAAVTQRSISNRLSSYGSSDINWMREFSFDNEPPWENLVNYWRQSPLQYIGNARTPTLVIHSENDFRCPIEQGEQIFVALKRLGVETEMVRFPDTSHGLSRNGRTDRRIIRLQHILRWFDKYLKTS